MHRYVNISDALPLLHAAPVVRTLTGHKASVHCLDFHPYGEFIASGSLDTNVKVRFACTLLLLLPLPLQLSCSCCRSSSCNRCD